MDPYLAPLPQGVPGTVQRSSLQTDPHRCTTMAGRGAWIRLFQRILKALGLSVPSCSEDFFNSVSGAVARPGAVRATAASLRNALSLGDCTLGVLCKDIPEGALDEVHTWGYADDEEAFETSSSTLTVLAR